MICRLSCIILKMRHCKMFINQKTEPVVGKNKLFLLLDGQKSHYCLIKNFSNLMHQLHRSSRKRCKGPKSKFCDNCVQPIIRSYYRKHLEFCEDHKPLEITMPQFDTTLSFNSWQRTQLCLFVVYADLEAIDVPSDSGSQQTRISSKQYQACFDAVLFDQRSSIIT